MIAKRSTVEQNAVSRQQSIKCQGRNWFLGQQPGLLETFPLMGFVFSNQHERFNQQSYGWVRDRKGACVRQRIREHSYGRCRLDFSSFCHNVR